jgi:hypothetical protein
MMDSEFIPGALYTAPWFTSGGYLSMNPANRRFYYVYQPGFEYDKGNLSTVDYLTWQMHLRSGGLTEWEGRELAVDHGL